jgi:hypothetical protein
MLAVVVLAAVPVFGPATAPRGTPIPVVAPTRADEAVIVRSASTNTAGYTLHVFSNGRARLFQGNLPARRTVPLRLVSRFFDDLRAAGDLARLPSNFCMKSASFGTTVRIGYRGVTSPDVSCPGTSRIERMLSEDVDALANAAGVSMLPGPRAP